jgi:LPXTG-site transpeptidase (sortase) family protein
MWKTGCIVFLMVLVGCGQLQSTSPIQSAQHDKQENAVKQQKEDKPVVETKVVKPKDIYAGVFDKPQDPIIPKKLTIDRIGVDAAIEKVGKEKNGEMGVPKDYKNTGWYESGTQPGDQGNAVIDGHVNDPEGKGVFWDLGKLETGDEVKVSDANGETLTFEVIGKKSFPLGEAPVKEIFGYTSRRTLNLITCTGDFDYDRGTHEERLVVYTELKKD